MEFDFGSTRSVVTRSGSRPSVVAVSGLTPVGDQLSLDPSRSQSISNEEWKQLLGAQFFGLPSETQKWGPSFRSLLSYFIRRQADGGFHTAFKHNFQQSLGDQQVNISYLVRLDSALVQEWEEVRAKERSIRELRKAASDGVIKNIVGIVAELRTELVVAEDRVRALRRDLSDFRVVEEYGELQDEASELSRRIATLSDENTLDRHYLAELEAAMEAESPPDPGDLSQLYDEAGITLPTLTLQRFAEVQRFHESVIRNRRLYLQAEAERSRDRLSSRSREIDSLDRRRSQIMVVLRSGGALETYTALQAELNRHQAHGEMLRQRYEAAKRFESERNSLSVERQRLLERLQQDYREQSDLLNTAILTFERYSHALYGSRAGSLTISEGLNGPIFNVKIPAEKSKGIGNMQIFCFDLTLMELALKQGRSPRFLVHDSHLFDGVDERQIAAALTVGAKSAREHGYQYIVTMNSDILPRRFPSEFHVEEYVLPTVLTDATVDGGLFGIRFG